MVGRSGNGPQSEPTKPGSSGGDGDAPARVRQLVVVASPSPGSSRTVTLTHAPLVLGRAPEGPRTLVLEDDEVSRSHTTIEYDAAHDAYVLVDRGSRNGTHVGGVRVTRAPLGDGSVIRVGRSLLVFVETALAAHEVLAGEAHGLLGQGLRMQRLRGEIARVAPTILPVLVLGESGTGKELVAGALHAESGRKGPLVAVNCAAIPEALAESQLFGHVPGAFTGASARNDGLFVAADGGTLFLDEVAELPAAVQGKLLRTLATGEVRPLGRTDPRTVDVRLVAATHRDVARGVATDTFRGDLLARLAGWTLRVPALRERREDILHLAAAFLARSGAIELTTSAAEALLLYAWPYNVRELEQVLAAAAVRAGPEGRLRAAHLPPELVASLGARAASSTRRPARPPLAVLVPPDRVPDGEALRVAFERLDGNLARVAEHFGRDRRQIYRWLAQAGIDVASLRKPDDDGS